MVTPGRESTGWRPLLPVLSENHRCGSNSDGFVWSFLKKGDKKRWLFGAGLPLTDSG
jgi:hypothetical protein